MILGAWLSVILRKSSIFWRSDLCQQPSLRAFNTSPRTSSIIDCTKGDRTGGVGTAACGDIFSGVASPLAGHTVKDCLLMSARITSQECNKNSSASKPNTDISCLWCSRHLKAGVLLLNTVLKKLAYSDTDSFDGIKGKRAYPSISWQQWWL